MIREKIKFVPKVFTKEFRKLIRRLKKSIQ